MKIDLDSFIDFGLFWIIYRGKLFLWGKGVIKKFVIVLICF